LNLRPETTVRVREQESLKHRWLQGNEQGHSAEYQNRKRSAIEQKAGGLHLEKPLGE
jgi:hypothetical protein